MATTATRKSLRASDPTPDTLAEIQRKAQFTITCESGAHYEIRAVTLDDLATDDGIPDDLIRVALLESHQAGGASVDIAAQLKKGDLDGARELAASLGALRDRIVLRAVVSPKLKPADVAKLDPFDRQTIAQFAQRQRNVDAAGRQVGADTLDTFRRTCAQLARGEADEARKGLLLELADLQ